MIKDRNIDPLAAISPSKIAGGGMVGAGEVFYVYNSNDDATVGNYLKDRVPKDNLFNANTAAADVAINAALAKCVAHRNDYVVIMPSDSNYKLTATIAVTTKSTHLIGVGNAGFYGAQNLIRIDARGQAFPAITTSSGGIEIAGIYCNTGTDQGGIYCTDGTVSGYGLNIHHNSVFVYSSGTGTGFGIKGFGSAAGGYSNIARNWIRAGTGAVGTVAYGIGFPNTATYVIISENLIQCINDNTMTSAINAQGYGCCVLDNIIVEHQAHGGTGAATIDSGIFLQGSGFAAGNRIGITTTANSITGNGVAGKAYVLNYDSTTAGGTLLNG